MIRKGDTMIPRRNKLAFASMVAALLLALSALAIAQETYLQYVASDPDSTNGEARLLHYLPDDVPVSVVIEPVDRPDEAEVRDRIIAAFSAWQDAAPELVGFRFVDVPTERTLRVRWQEFDDGRVGSYAYRFQVLSSGVYRFWTVEILLDPRHDSDAMYRYALLEVGHALGLLGRSPFPGDAMSAVPSGQITARDVATLRALYAVPSGTVLSP